MVVVVIVRRHKHWKVSSHIFWAFAVREVVLGMDSIEGKNPVRVRGGSPHWQAVQKDRTSFSFVVPRRPSRTTTYTGTIQSPAASYAA